MSFLERFRHAVATGALKADAGQEAAAYKLHALSRALATYRPGFVLSRPEPRGLYLWGDVGRGKSMLMDMFFHDAPLRAKRRAHFNAFMTEIHALLHEERKAGRDSDPIRAVAKRIVPSAVLLCFDEFQVNDVADAMILGRLFERMFARGTVLVATSNTEPDKLYEDGLNRQLFLPFVAMLKRRTNVVCIDGSRDYRHGMQDTLAAYFTPLGIETEAAMDASWHSLTGGNLGHAAYLSVLGRQLNVPRAAGGAARFSFDELCGAALGAGDYLAVAHHYHTVLIDHIPALTPDRRDEARRFTLLIDSFYDQGVRLICSAAVPAEQLYPTGDGAAAFRRTASRLLEMRGQAYISRTKR